MFGNNKRLEKKLQSSGGKTAVATVIECRTGMTITNGNAMIAANTQVVCKLRLQVTPDGEPAFEASTSGRFSQFDIPTQGSTVSVIYDPADHSKVVVDGAGAAQMHAILQKQIDRFRAQGTELGTTIADHLEQAHAEGRLEDPKIDRASIQAYNAAFGQVIQEAKESAGFGPGPVVTIGGQVVSNGHVAAAVDPVEQLTKLAALHDKGVLTDAEFAAEKTKILSAS
jgi:hypothetical protein